MNKLITEVSILEDVMKNGEGLDPKALMEALTDTEFSEPVDGDELLKQLRAEGLL